MSEAALKVDELQFLDDIIITHGHADHYSPNLMQELVKKFPDVSITAPPEVVSKLSEQGITLATSIETPGITFFDAPHEKVEPLFPTPQQIGVHYLDMLSDPGDSHSFTETKAILALPITGPWGTVVNAVNLAIRLKPKYVLPVHDWHWSSAARDQMYQGIEAALAKEGIEFVKLTVGQPITINA